MSDKFAGGIRVIEMTTEIIRFTEYLDLDIDREIWLCHSCGNDLISARENYKRGCLVAERDPSEIHSGIPVIPQWDAT